MITETRSRFGGVGTRMLTVDGSGTPIVLLHGYADTADTWLQVMRGLARAGRWGIAVDLPGFGHADPRGPGPLVEQFDAFVDAVLGDVGPAVLMGNSLGAACAVRAAARRPASVAALVALDDPINARHWLARLARRRAVPAKVWSTVDQIPMPGHAVKWVTSVAARRVLYGPGAAVDRRLIAQWSEAISRPQALSTLGRYAFQYALETSGGHEGVRVTCPALIVHGAHDRIIPVHASLTLQRQIPGSELVVLPRSGHCPQLDNPDEVVRLTLRLLDRIQR